VVVPPPVPPTPDFCSGWLITHIIPMFKVLFFYFFLTDRPAEGGELEAAP
jgi:hypothetical protein